MTHRLSLRSILRRGLFLAALAAISPLAALHAQSQTPTIQFVRHPDPAPDFQLTDFQGQPLSITANHGKVVILNFWATWCGPCRAEIPSLIELQRRYKDQLTVIGLAIVDEGEDAENVRKVVQSEGINYPVAIANNQIRIAYGGIPALPTAFLINPEGGVVQKHVGLFNPALYEVEVRALLGMPVPVKVEYFEDAGEIFLKHADRATSLPGVDLESLTPAQRIVALHKLNAELCPCPCKYTVAQCRIYDPPCHFSKDRAEEIVKELNAAPPAAKPAENPSETPATAAPPAAQSPNP